MRQKAMSSDPEVNLFAQYEKLVRHCDSAFDRRGAWLENSAHRAVSGGLAEAVLGPFHEQNNLN